MFTAAEARLLGAERSGVKETLMLLTRTRRPPAPEEIFDLLRRGFDPLSRSWSKVGAVGSPESVQLANQVMDQVTELMEVATAFSEGRRQILTAIRGVVWTDREQKAYANELRALSKLRKEFTELARRETERQANEGKHSLRMSW